MSRLTLTALTAAALTTFAASAQAEAPLSSAGDAAFSLENPFGGEARRRRYRRHRRPRVTHRSTTVVRSSGGFGSGVIFGQIGAGSAMEADTDETPLALGAGFRYEAGNAAVEVSGRSVFGENRYGESTLENTSLRLMGHYMLNGDGAASPYFGAGMGVSNTHVESQGVMYEGQGLSAEVAAGFSFLRHSPVRMNVEAAASLPFYNVDRAARVAAFDDELYVPTFTLNLGLGFQAF